MLQHTTHNHNNNNNNNNNKNKNKNNHNDCYVKKHTFFTKSYLLSSPPNPSTKICMVSNGRKKSSYLHFHKQKKSTLKPLAFKELNQSKTTTSRISREATVGLVFLTKLWHFGSIYFLGLFQPCYLQNSSEFTMLVGFQHILNKIVVK